MGDFALLRRNQKIKASIMVLKKVYNVEWGDDHAKDLVWTYKVYQERAQFTDVSLICKNGEKINAHGAILLRHCPQLRMIAAKFTCCYCHGTDCGGCGKNDNLMSLSVPDFTKDTVLAFLELIYTGRTFFQNNYEYERVVDLGKHLGFAVPASGLTFVQGDYEEERTNQRARNKRKSMDTSTPKPRKRSKTTSTSVESEPMEIQIEAVETSPLPFTCAICHKNFASKYLM